MMKPTRLSLIGIVLAVSSAASAAEPLTEVPLDRLDPPSPGKAVVYFFLPGDTPAIPSIPLFDTEVQLPNLLGAREYVRYEVEPGLHTFAAGAAREGGEWVHGDLEAGGIYAALISYFLGDLVVVPLTGRMDPDLLLSMNTEGEQWARIVTLIESKPPKPPGKERDGRLSREHVEEKERLDPRSGFNNLVRLNPETKGPVGRTLPIDRLPAPVEGNGLVVFFVPERKAGQSTTIHEGDHRLGPDLAGGSYYTYETPPGTKTFWVEEVAADYTVHRLVAGTVEPGRVYAILVSHSYGGGGARLFSLTGKRDTRNYFVPETEMWVEIDPLWNSPGGALSIREPVDSTSLKRIRKQLNKKSKKRHSELVPIR